LQSPQAGLREIGTRRRGEVEPPSPKMDQSRLKLASVPLQTGANLNQLMKEFREIFGL